MHKGRPGGALSSSQPACSQPQGLSAGQGNRHHPNSHETFTEHQQKLGPTWAWGPLQLDPYKPHSAVRSLC